MNVRLSNAALSSFAIFKHHLQLEEAAQSSTWSRWIRVRPARKRVRCFRTLPVWPYASDSDSRSVSVQMSVTEDRTIFGPCWSARR